MPKLTRAEKRALKKQNSLLEVKDTCINCGEHITLDQRFCSHCGGKRIYNKLTWRKLLEDFADRFLNLENSFLKTFIALFKRPEDVIGGYVNGMRKKYLPAFSYFAIAVTVSGFYAFLLKGWFLDDLFAAQTNLYSGAAAQAQMETTREVTSLMMDYQSLYMFLSIPIMAIISRVVFWNYKKYNFVEHFVIFLYTYSHISMISVVLNLSVIWNPTALSWVGVFTFVLLFAYTAFVLKRLFGLDAGGLILKSGLFFIVMLALSILLAIPFMGYVIYTVKEVKDGKELDENTFVGKILKPQMELEKAKRKRKDSITQDSIRRQKTTLEITPEMIKDSLE